MNSIYSTSQALAGSDAVFDLGTTLALFSFNGAPYLAGSYWPRQIAIVSTGGIAMAAALEYVNVGGAAPVSTYDGIASGTSLTTATQAGAYLFDPTANYPFTIYTQPYPVQMKTNIKVHVFGASGTALISFLR